MLGDYDIIALGILSYAVSHIACRYETANQRTLKVLEGIYNVSKHLVYFLMATQIAELWMEVL